MSSDVFVDGIHLINVHDETQCAGRACVIHNPTDHRMRDHRLHWRSDRRIFERLCPVCGCGCPDPSQFEFWRETGREWQMVHGCCGQCVGGHGCFDREDDAVADENESGGGEWLVGVWLAAGAFFEGSCG